MAGTVNIATLEIDVNDFIKSATDAKKKIEELTKANKDLKAAEGDNTQAIVQNEIALKNARQQYSQNINSAKGLQLATAELTKTIETEGKSVQQVIQDRNKLIQLSKNIKGNTQEEIALRDKLNKAIDEQTEVIRGNSSQYSSSKDMIGEYKQALSGLSPQLASILDTAMQLKDAFLKQASVLKGVIVETQAKTAADKAQAASQGIVKKGLVSMNAILKLFKIALASTGIGLLVVALGSLITFLLSTQKGIDAVNSVLTPLKAVFSALVGQVQIFGEKIFDAFSNPKQLMIDLVDFIKNNVINRFKAIGVIFDAIVNRDMKGLNNGLLQLATGVEDVIGKTEAFGKKTKEVMDEAYKKGQRLAKLDVEISKGKNQLILDEAKLKNEIKKGNQLAENAALSAKEREKGAKDSIEASRKLLALQQDLNNKEIERAELAATLNDTSREDQMAINELKAKSNELDTAQLELITTQTTKLNSIRTQAANADAKAKEEAFKKTQQQLTDELELYLANQGEKAKTLAQEVVIAQEVANKKQDILDVELANGKISQEKYAAESLKISQELLGKQALLAVENAFNQAEAERLQIDQTIKNQQDKNNALLEVEKEYQAARLEQGIISETEFNEAITALNEENRIAQAELEAERLAIDKENRLEAQSDDILSQLEIQKQNLAEKKALELENAEKTGADTTFIKNKYAKYDEDIERKKIDAKLELANNALGNIAAIFGKESKVAKAAAIAQTTIDTYKSATAAYSALAGITIVGPVLGALAAGAAVAAGLANVKKITSTKAPKAARGAMIGGLPHSQGGTMIEAERGEAIVNANSTSRFKPLLSAINVAGGGVSFGATSQTQNDIFNYDAMGRQFENAVSKMPAPVVAVEEINDVSKKYTKVVERASI